MSARRTKANFDPANYGYTAESWAALPQVERTAIAKAAYRARNRQRNRDYWHRYYADPANRQRVLEYQKNYSAMYPRNAEASA